MRIRFDSRAADAPGRLPGAPRRHRAAVLAVVAHERLVVRVDGHDRRGHRFTHIEHGWIHLPEYFHGWWTQHRVECWSTLERAAATCWPRPAQPVPRNIDVDWIFLPQPPGLAGRTMDRRPEFLIFWHGRAQNAVLVEVDDGSHPPSQHQDDQAKEPLFETCGLNYLRFSARTVLANPLAVATEIAEFRPCSERRPISRRR